MRLDAIVEAAFAGAAECPDLHAARLVVLSGRVSVDGVVLRTPTWQVLSTETVSIDGHPNPHDILQHKLIFHHKVKGTLSQKRPANAPSHRGSNVYDGLPESLRYAGLGLFGRLDKVILLYGAHPFHSKTLKTMVCWQ